jgi:hypothetical protein
MKYQHKPSHATFGRVAIMSPNYRQKKRKKKRLQNKARNKNR